MLAAGKIEDLRADNSMLSSNLDRTQKELGRTRARLERLTDRDPETGRFVRREPGEAV
jgi:dynactin complex subunit